MRSLVVLLLLLLGACRRELVGPEPAEIAGRYAQALFDLEGNPAPGYPTVGSLVLSADGRYEAWVLNGITADGCTTFEGAGLSRGSWTIAGRRLVFEADDEPADLALSFDGATARLADEGLLITIDERERRLVTNAEQGRAVAAWEQR